MKLNISNPETGAQKLIDIDDEKRLRPFFEKRMAQEVEADSLGDEWKGYAFRISGGNDKQGFPMKQGVMTNGRVRLLLSKGHSCYRPRRTGERKRKSVRGCIVDANLSVLSLIIRRKGEKPIEGLTDVTVPRRLGPKRASRIRKLFNLTKEDDVKQFVVRRPLVAKEGTEGKIKRGTKTKAPKIQRLITPQMLQHKRRKACLKQARITRKQEQAADYAKLIAQRTKEAQEKKAELARKRRSTRESQSSGGGDDVKAKKPKVEAKLTPALKKEAKKEGKALAKEAKSAPAKAKSAPGKTASAPASKGKVAAPAKDAPKKAAGTASAPAKEQKKATATATQAAKPAGQPAAKKAAPKKK